LNPASVSSLLAPWGKPLDASRRDRALRWRDGDAPRHAQTRSRAVEHERLRGAGGLDHAEGVVFDSPMHRCYCASMSTATASMMRYGSIVATMTYGLPGRTSGIVTTAVNAPSCLRRGVAHFPEWSPTSLAREGSPRQRNDLETRGGNQVRNQTTSARRATARTMKRLDPASNRMP